jgi:hypothetical protein
MRLAKELRDRILDRAGASGSSPGARLVDLARISLGSVPSELGEPRLKRWFDVAVSGGGRQTPERTLRDFAGIHAVVLAARNFDHSRCWAPAHLCAPP